MHSLHTIIVSEINFLVIRNNFKDGIAIPYHLALYRVEVVRYLDSEGRNLRAKML